MTSEQTARRGRYSNEMKVQVLAECEVPGASVAKVAMSHGINANVVHGWRRFATAGMGEVSGSFTPSCRRRPRSAEQAFDLSRPSANITLRSRVRAGIGVRARSTHRLVTHRGRRLRTTPSNGACLQ